MNRRTTCAHESGAFAAKKFLTSAAEQSASESANLSSKIGSRSTRAWAERNCAVLTAVRLAPSIARSFPSRPSMANLPPSAALPVKNESA